MAVQVFPRTHIANCDFPGASGPPARPLDPPMTLNPEKSGCKNINKVREVP